MNSQPLPPITLSSVDVDRIESLLESPLYRDFPARAPLEAELERAEVVDPEEIPESVVTMNSRVRFVEEGSGREIEVDLVYPASAGGEGKISVFAPVGSALLGLSVGQTIEWPLPSGQKRRLRIVAVTYQPEAAGDSSR